MRRFDNINRNGEFADQMSKLNDDKERTADLRDDGIEASSIRIEGASTYDHVHPGYKFELTHHCADDVTYLLTRVEQSASLEGAYASGSTDVPLSYENRFQCLPENLTYRPTRATPKPRIEGQQTATVVGQEPQPALCQNFIDKYGRVKVQFRWDREGRSNAGSSCWVRVAQPWAGKSQGFSFWPRVGDAKSSSVS